MKRIYWGGIEYLYKSTHPQFNILKGGFVYVFNCTEDSDIFLKNIYSTFLKENLEIIKIEFISLYDKKMKWEKSTDTKKYNKLIKLAESSNAIVFDEFYAYEKE